MCRSFLALVSQDCHHKLLSFSSSLVAVKESDFALPSLTIPTTRHFWKRQNWQRFLLLLSTGQSLLARQTYFAFFCTVRCQTRKKEIHYFQYTVLHFYYWVICPKSFASLAAAVLLAPLKFRTLRTKIHLVLVLPNNHWCMTGKSFILFHWITQ